MLHTLCGKHGMSRKHHRWRLRIRCSCGETAPETLTDPWTWPTLCHAPARHHVLLQLPVRTALPPPPFLGGSQLGWLVPSPLFWVTGQFQSGQLVQVLHCEEQSTVIGLINLHSIPQNLNSWLSTLVSIANVVNEVWPWLCLTIALQPYVLLV